MFFNERTWVTLHVDDLMIVSDSDEDIGMIKRCLSAKYESITCKESGRFKYLGMNIERNQGEIKITMGEYILDVTSEVTKISKTPATKDLFVVSTNELIGHDEQDKMRSTVAKLLFIATHARPDILIATNFLCGRAEKYTSEDLEKLQRILQYLKGCPNDGITLRGEEDLTITAYADASFGTHTEDCFKSHSGLVVKVGTSSIVMKTNKQKLVTKSSCEAELVSASDAIPMVCYLRDWLKEKGLIVPKINLLQDNMSTISLITNEVQGSMRSRHISKRMGRYQLNTAPRS